MAPMLEPGSRHPIPIRRPDFPFEAPPDGPIPRHWLADNAVATHVFNGLNLTFPDGERFFIKAVNDALPRVRDPALVAQARAFAGQEAMHGREHERYFANLRDQGYAIDGFLRRFRAFIAWSNRRLPVALRLAMTAGAEHYTATFGHFALGDPLLERAHPLMRDLVWWHATEEVEHKAVAFDVMQAAGVGYAVRVLGFLLATLALFGWSGAATRRLLRQDALPRDELRRQRRALRAQGGAARARALLRRIAAYLRPGFHPNEVDDLALAHARLAQIGLAAEPG